MTRTHTPKRELLARLFSARFKSPKRFARDERGAFAIQLALMAIPLFICTGLAIDGGRAFLTRYQLGAALDAAALAVGSSLADGVEINQVATKFVAANFKSSDTTNLVTNATLANDTVTVTGTVKMATYFMPLVGVNYVDVAGRAEAKRGGANVEVAMVLDVTGSMSGARITNLKKAAKDLVDIVIQDDQSVFYSKVGMVPYSNAVHAGTNAAAARGNVIPDVTISAATWRTGTEKSVASATKANPGVFTSNAHGFINDDYVYVSGTTGNWTSLNGFVYQIKSSNANTFRLRKIGSSSDTSTSGLSGNYPGGMKVQKCLISTCEVQVTANGHGLAENEYFWLQDAAGMTGLNVLQTSPWQAKSVTANTFVVTGTAQGWPNYTANSGKIKCLRYGCEYYRFLTGDNSTIKTIQASNCVTERFVGDKDYTDDGPASYPVGFYYPTSPCLTTNNLVPMTANDTVLNAKIDALTIAGNTAGHIGIAWGYYMLSPNWSSLWPAAENKPADYGKKHLLKAMVIMTDGEFNSAYCNGVVSKNYNNTNSVDNHSCNANNGDPFDQAKELCKSIKASGIVIYSVGVELGSSSTASDVLKACASKPEYFYDTSAGSLQEAFQKIGQSITRLRLSK